MVDAVAGVEAHAFSRNTTQADIDRLDVNLGAAFFLRVVEAGLVKNIRQKRIVDLQQDAGVDDRPVFLAHFHSQRVEILLVRFVILVLADAGRRGRRQKHMLVGNAGGRGGSLHILNVGRGELFAAIFDRSDANDRRQRDNGAAHHRPLEILLVVFRERRRPPVERTATFMPGREFEAFETFADVGEEAGLGKFSVGDDVDATIDLLAHHGGDRAAQYFAIRGLVVILPGIFGLDRIEQRMRPRQAADMRRLDAVGILLKLHVVFSRATQL